MVLEVVVDLGFVDHRLPSLAVRLPFECSPGGCRTNLPRTRCLLGNSVASPASPILVFDVVLMARLQEGEQQLGLLVLAEAPLLLPQAVTVVHLQ